MNMQRIAIAALLAASCAIAASAEPLPANIAAAAKDPARTEQAKVDAVRHGPEILAFAGVQPEAKVVDLIPGGGYWTGLFSASVGSSGHVYAIWPAEYVKVDGDEVKPYREVAAKYANVSILEQPAAGFAAPEKVDLVFTAQNYHDYPDKFMGKVDPVAFDKAVYKALKPGGVFLVIDHQAEPGSGMRDTDTLHRIEGAIVKKQAAEAGFVFDGQSKVLRNPADDHKKAVFDKSIRGKTDQFVYRFRKPAHAKG